MDKSLVQREDDGRGDYRFRLLESVREFAFDQMLSHDQGEVVGQGHAQYYLELAERAEPELFGPRQRAWFLRLEETQDNLRAALEWLLDHDEGEPALRLAVALAHFWEIRGYLAEGRRWLEAALAGASPAAPALRARALTWLGAILVLSVDRTGVDGIEQAAQAEEVLTDGMELARTIRDAVSVARALTFLGVLSLQTGEWERGKRVLQEAQTAWQDAGYDGEIIQVLVPLGVMAFLQGQHEEAVQLMDEILTRHQDVGDDWGRGIALLFSMNVIATRGDLPRAVAMGQELLALSVQSESGRLLYLSAAGVGWLMRSEGRPERLARLIGAAGSMYCAMGLVASVMQRVYVAPTREALQARMGQEELDAAVRAGRHVPFSGVAALVREVLEEALRLSTHQKFVDESKHTGLLSPREVEVLQLIAQGLTNKQIAHELIIAESMVRYYLTSIFNKLGVDSRAHALAVAAQRGLIQLGQKP